MAKLEGISNDWASIISFIVNKPTNNTIWSVIQRLVLGACVYFVWQERNLRWVRKNFIDEDCLFKIIVNTVRMKLLDLTIKNTLSVTEAAKIWGLQLNKNDYYKRMYTVKDALILKMEICSFMHQVMIGGWEVPAADGAVDLLFGCCSNCLSAMVYYL
ncbi:hypothetical protein Tco_1352856 [Tanacetum coccineum]